MTNGWYAAVDRVRAYWMLHGERAEFFVGGTLLALAVMAFAVNVVLR